ncbi:hypothetical protein ACS0TY_006688 [Phlomoides rotata]
MITARIAFNLHFVRPHPVNQPLRNPYSPISRPSLRFHSGNAFPLRFRRIHIAYCTENSFDSTCGEIVEPSDSYFTGVVESANTATWLGVATLTNKILGLLREATMASVFGVGAVATSFKYAWVLPGFSSLLLGGVNGPIHIIMSATLSKLPKERGKKLFQHLTTIMFLVGGIVATLVYNFPEFILQSYAPGLWILTEGKIIRELAMEQLKIMTPCIVLAGPVGLGFGYMSAEGNDALPSISPAISSSLLIVACLFYTFTKHLNASSTGGKLVSFAASLGLFLQWVIQVIVLRRRWSCIIPGSFISILKGGDVFEFFSLLLPATVSSGLAQIASFTDLCFASHIPDAASGLSYAYLMVMAPLGALSTIIILPLVPTFCKFVKTSSWKRLGDEVERSLLLCMVLLLPAFSIMHVLAEPAIHVFFKYFALDASASAQVSTLFSAYSVGAPFFFARDLLVAVFYAFGDGKGPFLVSAGAIAVNAFLDWLSVSKLNLGAEGLALSTSFIATLSVFLLYHLLKMKLSGLSNYTVMFYPAALLLICSITSNLTTSAGYKLIRELLASKFLSRYDVMKEVLTVSIASVLGLVGFFLPALLLHLTGFELVRNLYRILIKQQSLRPVAKSFNS